MAVYAETLARTYMNGGENSRDWKDYLKAHGLANYCVAVDSTPERCRLVYDIEASWYQGNHPISYKEHQELTIQHKQLLKEYRDEVKSNFSPLDHLGLLLDAEDVYSDENMTNAHKFCDELFELSRKSSDEFVNVTKNIVESSVEALMRIKLNPPCGFVVIGLGSVAKGEATPYSDLEYAFIIERDDTYYFEMLAMDSYFRIGNLGETPLKCFNIEEVKAENGSPPIIAELRSVGFRIDGISENAGNIPTGNGLENGQPLTFTVDNLMKLYKTSAESPFAGLADKSDMLSSTVVIYTNEGDTSQLHNRFIEERMYYELNVAQKSVHVKQKRVKCFCEDVKNFDFQPTFTGYGPPRNMNIKTDIFRYPTLLANNMKLFMGWDMRYSWQIYTKLYTSKKISEKVYSYIRIILSLSIYMRTRVYLYHRSQTNSISLIPQLTGSVKEWYQVPTSLFVVLGCLLVPIQLSVKSNVENISLTPDGTSLADVVNSVMRHMEFVKTNAMAKVEICYFAGEYKLASRELSKVVKAAIETATEFLERVQQAIDSSSVNKYMELCCYILYRTGSYKAAADFFSWLIHNGQGDIGFWKVLSAHCKKETGDYRAARQLLDEAKQCLGQTHGSHNNIPGQSLYAADTNHRDISNSYKDIGTVYREMGECEEAIKYHQLALEMDIAMVGETVHPDIALDHHDIGCAYMGLGEYTSALDCFINSLEMRKTIYGADINHPDIASSYNNIASVHYNRGDHVLSLEYHSKSLEMMKAIYGQDTSHAHIATSYHNIATVYDGRGDHMLSLENYVKSLEMRKAIYGADNSHPDIASSYNNIANAYNKHGDYALSLEYHCKSLELYKAIYGADANHPSIATSYHNIASVYDDRGDHTLSLELNMKSLEMRRAIYGAHSNHHSHIADSYNNIANVYNNRGDHTLSLEYHNKSLEMKQAIYGADTNHADIADSYHNIACVYDDRGDQALSVEYYHKSLEMMKGVYGVNSNHPHIVKCKRNIARTKNDDVH